MTSCLSDHLHYSSTVSLDIFKKRGLSSFVTFFIYRKKASRERKKEIQKKRPEKKEPVPFFTFQVFLWIGYIFCL